MKSASGAVGFSREQVIQGTPAIDGIVMRDLAYGAGLLFDDAVLAGSGAANNPRRVLSILIDTNTGSYTTANGLSWAQALACETSLADG